MNNEKILYYLGILENGALNYYQTVETIRIASQSIQNYIEQLEQQCKKQKEVIDKAINFIKNAQYDAELQNHVYGLNFSGVKRLLDILKEVSE